MASMSWRLTARERDGEHDVERTDGVSLRTGTSIARPAGLMSWDYHSVDHLLSLALAASDDSVAKTRELSALLFWTAAQRRRSEPPPPSSATVRDHPAAFDRLCVLANDCDAGVRRRACVLLASMPRPPASKIDAATNKRAGVSAKLPKFGAAGPDVMELSLIEDAVTPEAAAALAASASEAALEESMTGVLQMALEDEFADVREAAVCAIADLMWPEGGAAAAACAPASAERVVGLLVDSCADEAASVRARALEKLLSLGERLTLHARHLSAVAACAAEASERRRSSHPQVSDGCARTAIRLLGACRVADRAALLEAVGGLVGALRTHATLLEAEVRRSAAALAVRHAPLVLGKAKADLRKLSSGNGGGTGGSTGGAPTERQGPSAMQAAPSVTTAKSVVAELVLQTAIATKRTASATASSSVVTPSSQLLAPLATPPASGAVVSAVNWSVSGCWGGATQDEQPATASSGVATVEAVVTALNAAATALSAGSNFAATGAEGIADTAAAGTDRARSALAILRRASTSLPSSLPAATASATTSTGAPPAIALPSDVQSYLLLRLTAAARVCQLVTLLRAGKLGHLGSSGGAADDQTGSIASLRTVACSLLGDSYELQYGFSDAASTALLWLRALRLYAHVLLRVLASIAPSPQPSSQLPSSQPSALISVLLSPQLLESRVQLAEEACCRCETLPSAGARAAASVVRQLLDDWKQVAAAEPAAVPVVDALGATAPPIAVEWLVTSAPALVQAPSETFAFGVPAPWSAYLDRAAADGACRPAGPLEYRLAIEGHLISYELPWRSCLVEASYWADPSATPHFPGVHLPPPISISPTQIFELEPERHCVVGRDRYLLAHTPLRLTIAVPTTAPRAAFVRLRVLRRFAADVPDFDNAVLRFEQRFAALASGSGDIGLALRGRPLELHLALQ